MTPTELDVAIIGAGTAGLSARAEVAKTTDSYRVFDPGPWGTACARNACMPSKALLKSAHDFHRRHAFDALGLVGGDQLRVDSAQVLARTRALRDSLVKGVLDSMKDWSDAYLVAQEPVFGADGLLHAGGEIYRPRATIIATGSRPVVPAAWREQFGDRILTSDEVFEIENLPRRIAVVGLGPVGVELGQALARLGIEVTGFDPSPTIGGLQDPDLQSLFRDALQGDMNIVQAQADPQEGSDGAIRMQWDGGETDVDCMLAAMGRTSNLDRLGLDQIGIELREDGSAPLAPGQLNLSDTRIYFAGDAGHGPALLHEASDEGRVCGYFAGRDEDARFNRRVPLRIVFSHPQIAVAGQTWSDLEGRREDVAVGEASFDQGGRNKLERECGGALRIYAEKATARLLGVAIVASDAEHLAHLLSLSIGREDDLKTLLRMPAYHPTQEEILRGALRATLAKCDADVDPLDEIRCSDVPVDCEVSTG